MLYVIALTSFVAITYGFGKYIFYTLTPDIVASLGLSYEFVGIINSTVSLTASIASVLGGFLAASIGAKKVVIASTVLSAAGMIALFFCHNQWMLLVMIPVLGVLATTSWIPMVEMVAKTIRQENRGRSIGIISCGTSWGIILNGIFIPVILARMVWQWVWLFFGVFSLLVSLLGAYVVVKTKELDKDDTGACLPDAAAEAADAKKGGLSTAQYVLFLGMLFLSGFCLTPFLSYLSALLQEDFAISASVVGLCWTILGFLGIVSGFLSGYLADKYSAKKSMVVLYAIIVVAVAGLLLLHNGFFVVLFCGLFGLAYYGIFGLHATYVANIVPPEKTARLFGFVNVAIGLGAIAGNYITGYMKDYFGSFVLVYIIIGVLSAVCLGLCVAVRDDRRGGRV